MPDTYARKKIKRYARYICQKECQMICQIICLWSLGCKRVVISPSSLLESLAKQCQNICQIKCIKNVRIYVKQTALVGIIRSKGKHFFCTVLYIYFEHLDVFLAAEVAPGIAPYPRSRRSYDPPGALGPRAAQSGRSSPIPPAQRGDPPWTSGDVGKNGGKMNGYMEEVKQQQHLGWSTHVITYFRTFWWLAIIYIYM